jgi:hypothetical protein
MPLIRFKFFKQSGAFNDRQIVDKLAAIRQVSKEFVQNCKKTPTLSGYAIVNKKLEALRRRCFWQYIPSKHS